MKTLFIDKEVTYDGSQLRSLYAFLEHRLQGDSIVSWVGKCDIPQDKIVDGQDLMEGSAIYSEKMLHFIVEIFDAKLREMVLLQRLFGDIVRDEVFKIAHGKIYLLRKGDDLYLKDEFEALQKFEGKKNKISLDILNQAPQKNVDLKFNISIATVSPVSGLLHFGINISSKNTPVKTYSFEDLSTYLGVSFEPQFWAEKLMNRLSEEWVESKSATQKVKWVK